jgi:hypothetical protein
MSPSTVNGIRRAVHPVSPVRAHQSVSVLIRDHRRDHGHADDRCGG